MSVRITVPATATVATIVSTLLLGAGSVLLFSFVDLGPYRLMLEVTVGVLVVSISTNVYFFTAGSSLANVLARSMTRDIASSKQLFSELFKNSPVPYLLIDHTGTITLPNVASVRLFGLEEHDLSGKNVFDLMEVVTKEGDDVHAALVKTRYEQGVYINNEDVLIHRPDGTSRYGLLSVFTYGGRGWNKNGLLTLVDVTKQKEVDRVKTEFVSLASHQLHTPISAMKWNIELLVSKRFGNLSEAQYAYIEKIERAIVRMEAIIKDFLNVTELELGTVVTDIAPLAIADEIDEMLDENSGRINLKNLTIAREFGATPPVIATDKRLFKHAIGNLISNAVKYSREEGTVKVRIIDSGGPTIAIEIVDSGIGIPVEDQERLFTKFFRASNAREQEPDGTGLGLYIVALAIGVLGGTISFVSRRDEGTTFTVTLPR